MDTFLNKQNRPMIRSCGKCKHFKTMGDNKKIGYCVLQPTLFAYTLERSVYDIKKSYYLCEKHEFTNEEWLKENATSVDLKSALKDKKDIDYDF